MAKGFTLVELLVVVFIAILILGAVFTVSNVSSWSLQTGTSLSDIQWQTRKGMNRMLEELYVAGSSTVTIDNPGKAFITFQVPTVCLAATGCSDDTGTIHTSHGIINWGDGTITDYKIRYLVAAGQLVRRVLNTNNNPVSNTVLADDINAISFTGYDENENIDYTQPNTLAITLTGSKSSVQGRNLQSALSSQVTFRNQ